jgi:hypothetical protein
MVYSLGAPEIPFAPKSLEGVDDLDLATLGFAGVEPHAIGRPAHAVKNLRLGIPLCAQSHRAGVPAQHRTDLADQPPDVA